MRLLSSLLAALVVVGAPAPGRAEPRRIKLRTDVPAESLARPWTPQQMALATTLVSAARGRTLPLPLLLSSLARPLAMPGPRMLASVMPPIFAGGFGGGGGGATSPYTGDWQITGAFIGDDLKAATAGGNVRVIDSAGNVMATFTDAGTKGDLALTGDISSTDTSFTISYGASANLTLNDSAGAGLCYGAADTGGCVTLDSGAVNLRVGTGDTINMKVNASTEVFVDGDGLSVAAANTKNRGTIILSGGTGTATVRSGATCTCSDTTSAAAVQCAVATTTLTATGTGTDVIAYMCF